MKSFSSQSLFMSVFTGLLIFVTLSSCRPHEVHPTSDVSNVKSARSVDPNRLFVYEKVPEHERLSKDNLKYGELFGPGYTGRYVLRLGNRSDGTKHSNRLNNANAIKFPTRNCWKTGLASEVIQMRDMISFICLKADKYGGKYHRKEYMVMEIFLNEMPFVITFVYGRLDQNEWEPNYGDCAAALNYVREGCKFGRSGKDYTRGGYGSMHEPGKEHFYGHFPGKVLWAEFDPNDASKGEGGRGKGFPSYIN